MEKEKLELVDQLEKIQETCVHKWKDTDHEGRSNFDSYQCEKCRSWK